MDLERDNIEALEQPADYWQPIDTAPWGVEILIVKTDDEMQFVVLLDAKCVRALKARDWTHWAPKPESPHAGSRYQQFARAADKAGLSREQREKMWKEIK